MTQKVLILPKFVWNAWNVLIFFLRIWNSITVFTISNSDLAPKSIQELFYLKNHWCKRKKSVFIWINFSRKKIVIFRFVNTVNFFKSAVKKTWIESGHLKFFFWLCTIPSLFFYYPVCCIQRILKRRSEFWPFFYCKLLQKFSL